MNKISDWMIIENKFHPKRSEVRKVGYLAQLKLGQVLTRLSDKILKECQKLEALHLRLNVFRLVS